MQYMEMTQRNKLNRKGATALPVRLLLLAQTKKPEQRVGAHEDYGGNRV